MKTLRCYGGPLDGDVRPAELGDTITAEVPPDRTPGPPSEPKRVTYEKVTVYGVESSGGDIKQRTATVFILASDSIETHIQRALRLDWDRHQDHARTEGII